MNNQKLRRVVQSYGPILAAAERVVAAMPIVRKARVEKLSAPTVSTARLRVAIGPKVVSAIGGLAVVETVAIATTTAEVPSVQIAVSGAPILVRPAATKDAPIRKKGTVAHPSSGLRVLREAKASPLRRIPERIVQETSPRAVVGLIVEANRKSLVANRKSLAANSVSVATNRASVATSHEESSKVPILRPPPRVLSRCAAAVRLRRRQAVRLSPVSAVVVVAEVEVVEAASALSRVMTAAARFRKP